MRNLITNNRRPDVGRTEKQLSTIITTDWSECAQRVARLNKREVTYKWRNPLAQPDADGYRKQVTLSIYHDADRKQFSAVIRLSDYQVREGVEVSSYALTGSEAIHTRFPAKAVARYSAKALAEYEAETLALLNNADLPSMVRWQNLIVENTDEVIADRDAQGGW